MRITGLGDGDFDDEMVPLLFRASSTGDERYDGLTATARVDVADDDTVRLSVSSDPHQVVAEGVGQVQLELGIDPVASHSVALAVTAGDASGSDYGTAYPGQDYSLPGTISIPAGRSRYTVTIPILDDDVAEPGEAFEIRLSTQTRGVGIAHAGSAVTISDNDQAGIVLSAQDLEVREGSSVEYTVRLAAAAASPVEIAIVSSDAGAVSVEPAALSFSGSNWDVPQTVRVSGVVDGNIGNDTATIRHEASSSDLVYAALPPTALAVSAVDRDVVLLGMEQAVEVAEGATQLLLTLTVSPPVDYHVYVNVSAGADSDSSTADATAGQDYYLPSSRLSIGPGASSKAFAIAINEDVAAEGNEIFTVSFSTATFGVASEHDYTTVTIVDNDQAALIMSPSQLNVAEGAAAEYEVKLASMPSQWVSVLIGSSDPDLVAIDVSLLTFTQDNWDVARPITVMAAEDADSVGENITLTHEAISGALGYDGLGASSLSVTVSDNDTSTLSVSATEFAVAEDAATLELPLSLSPAAPEAVTVNVTVVATATSATAGLDYMPLPASVTIAPNTSSGRISLTILDDAVAETDEVLLLQITTTATGIGVATPEVEVTIRDDDPARIVLSKSGFVLAEGSSASYDVSLQSQPDELVRVRIELSATGDSVAGSITSRMPITFTRDNWNAAQTVSLAIHDDADHAGGEMTLTHVATGGSYASAAPVVVRVRVVDDDYASDVVYVSAPPVIELSENFGRSVIYLVGENEHRNLVTLQTSRPLMGTLFLNASIRDGDPAYGGVASSGSDYLSDAYEGELLWSISQEHPARPWAVIDDNIVEGDESFILSFAASNHRPDPSEKITVTGQQVVLVNTENIRVVIKDNDVLELRLGDVRALENDGYADIPLSYQAVGDARLPIRGLPVLVSTRDGTAISGSGKDYGSLHEREVRLYPASDGSGSGQVYIEVPIYQNGIDGVREFTLSVSSGNSSVRVVDGVSTVTIYDAPVDIRIMDMTVSESDGLVPLGFALSPPLSQPLRLDISSEDGLAASGLDYTLLATEVTIPAGVARYTTAAPALSIIDDSTVELSGKDFFVTAEAAGESSLLVNVERARIDIVDADSSELTVVAALQEGLDDSRLEFTLSGVVEVPLAISYELAALPGVSAPQDIVMGSFSIEVGAYQNGARLSVAIEDDIHIEGDEPFQLSVTGVTAPAHDDYDEAQLSSIASKVAVALASQRQQVAVVDNDSALAVTLADVTVPEDQVLAALPPQLQSAPTTALDIRVKTRDGTAVAGRDYVGLDYVLRYGAGQTRLPTIYARIIDDNAVNRNRDFYVDLRVGQGNAETTIASATVTIRNDERANISMSPTLTEVNEDAGTVQLQVLLNRTLSYPLTGTLNITSDSMQQVTRDYSIDNASFTIAAGSHSHTAVLSIVDDDRRDDARGTNGHDLRITPVVDDDNITVTPTAAVDIIDDEAGAGSSSLKDGINIDSLVFDESAGAISINGTLHPARDETVNVSMSSNFDEGGRWEYDDGPDSYGASMEDFQEDGQLIRGTHVVMNPGDTTFSIALGKIKDDEIVEDAREHVHIYFSVWTDTRAEILVYVGGDELGANGGETQLIIIDNDIVIHELALEDMEVSESAGSVTISLGEAGRRYIAESDFLEMVVRPVAVDRQAGQGAVPALEEEDYFIQKSVTVLSGRENDQATAPYQVSIDIIDDEIHEKDEVIRLQLSLGGPASSYIRLPDDNMVEIAIRDDDPKPALNIRTQLLLEGETGAGYALELERPMGYAVTATVTTSDLAPSAGGARAAAGADYVAHSQMFTIPAGLTGVTANIDVIDDDVVDPGEKFEITFAMSESFQFKVFSIDGELLDKARSTHADTLLRRQLEIYDNDFVSVRGSRQKLIAYEGTGEVIMLPVELTLPLQHEVRATVTIINARDRAVLVDSVDQQELISPPVIFPPGTQSKSVALRILDDDVYWDHVLTGNLVRYNITAYAYDEHGRRLFALDSDISHAGASSSTESGTIAIVDNDYPRTAGERPLIRSVNIYAKDIGYLREADSNYQYRGTETDVFTVDRIVQGDVVYLSVIAAQGATISVNGVTATSYMQQSPPIALSQGRSSDANIEVRHGHDVARHNVRIIYNTGGTLSAHASLSHPDGRELKERASLRVIMRLLPPPPVDTVLALRVDSARVVNAPGLPLIHIYSDSGEEYKPGASGLYHLPVAANQGLMALELRAPDYNDAQPRELTVTFDDLAVAGASEYTTWPLSGDGDAERTHPLATILPLTAADGTEERRNVSIERRSDTSFSLRVSPPPTSPLQVNLGHRYTGSFAGSLSVFSYLTLVDQAGNIAGEYDIASGSQTVMYPAGATEMVLQVHERFAQNAGAFVATLWLADGDYGIVANSRGGFAADMRWTYDSVRFAINLVEKDIVVRSGDTVPLDFDVASPSLAVSAIQANDRLDYEVTSNGGDRGDYKITAPGLKDVLLPALVLNGRVESDHLSSRTLLQFVSALDNDTEDEVYEFRLYGSSGNFRADATRVVRITVKPAVPILNFDLHSVRQVSASQQQSVSMVISSNIRPANPVPATLTVSSADGTPMREGDYTLEWSDGTGISVAYENGMGVSSLAVDAQVSALSISFTEAAVAGYGASGRDFKLEFASGAESVATDTLIHLNGPRRQSGLVTVVP